MGSKLVKKLRLFLYRVRSSVRMFALNIRGGLTARGAITIGIAFFLLAVMFPIAMTQVTGTNTTLWNTAVTTMFVVLVPILAIIGAAIKFLPGKGA